MNWYKNFQYFSTIFKFMWRSNKSIIFIFMLFEIFQGILPLLTAWVMKNIIDILVINSNSYNNIDILLLYMAIFIILILFTKMSSPINGYITNEIGRIIDLNTKNDIYRKINQIPTVNIFDNHKFYQTIDFAIRGSQKIPLQSITIIAIVTRNFITILSFIGILFAFNIWITISIFLALIPHVYFTNIQNKSRYNMAVDNNLDEMQLGYYGMVLSGIEFAKEVRLFNLSEFFLNKFNERLKAIQQRQRLQQKKEIIWQLSINLIYSLLSSIAFSIVVWNVLLGNLTIGDITFYISTVTTLQLALTGTITALAQIQESNLFFLHYKILTDLSTNNQTYTIYKDVPALRKGIEFRNISFRYSEEHPWIFQDFNLFIPANECTAIVGTNGAGKTTLIKLLTGLYHPTKGTILWDGIDIRSFNSVDFRSQISTIFQDFIRYEISVEDNIAVGDVKNFNKKEHIYYAAQQAHIHDKIVQLPQSYNTVLSRRFGEGKQNIDFSGGEWQKLALARMFFRQASMVILDEPTASLDLKTEEEVYTQFASIIRETTSLIVTHRLSTIWLADRIIVLHDGKVIEDGTHSDLLLLDGIYADLYRIQTSRFA